MLVRGLVVALLLAAACSSAERAATEERVVVLAAASLRGVLAQVEVDLERASPGLDIEVTADGSALLATAIREGAPADVFASADDRTMDRLVDAGEVDLGTARVIATNALVIVVAEGNPLGVTSLADLSGNVAVSLCRAEVPCGAYAAQAFARAAVPLPRAGREASVTAVLAKVRLGEADAGVVYRTDVLDADGVTAVELASDHNVKVRYLAAALRDAPNPAGARRVLDHLTSPATQRVLRRLGFGTP